MKKLLVCIALLLSCPSAQSAEELRLAELNPDRTALGVFHSHKHQVLLVALVQTEKSSFNCLPNQYILYQYGPEHYVEISAGNLKINSPFNRIFRTRIHSLSGLQQANPGQRDQLLQMLSKTLKVPPDLIADAQQESTPPGRICWQQPELLDMQGRRLRSYPFIAVNLCEKQWCSELYWTGPKTIRFWIHSQPREFQLIALDVEKSTYTVQSRSDRFTRPSMPQLNAPRQNLVNSKNLAGKSQILKKSAAGTVRLEWHKETSGRIVVRLLRDAANPKAAARELKRLRDQIKRKRYGEALRTAAFASWLNPNDLSIRIEETKVYLFQSRRERFFESLQRDYAASERFTACQKLHLDRSIRHFWKDELFTQRFRTVCSP